MKAIIAVIAALGAISSFAGAAIADVSISINLGSSPSYRGYSSYRPKIYQHSYSYPVTTYSHNNYSHNNYDRYNRNVNSTFVVRDVYPVTSYHDNSWNYAVPMQRSVYRANFPERSYNKYQGDRYIVEKRIIRVR
jgi:hypothetical protein